MSHARIIVATPDPAECEMLADWLAAEGFEPIKRTTLQGTAEAIQSESFDLFVADFSFAFRYRLHDASRRRIRDSTLPTIVIGDLVVAEQTRAESQQTMYLSRPVDRTSLTCLVSMAIFDGRPGRRSPRKNIKPLDTLVNGAPSRVLDVSLEGLRLAVLKGDRSSLPPLFNVTVPMIGMTVTVKRAWVRGTAGAQSTPLLCGASLEDLRGEKRWRGLVDTLPALGAMSGFTDVRPQ